MADILYSAFPNRKRRATCHFDRPHHAKGLCYSCYRRDHRLKHLDAMNTANKRRNITFNARFPERKKQIHRTRRYGITPEQYDKMLLAQHNQCKICLVEFGALRVKKASIDHDHNTKRVRGLLCSRCNSAIGMLRDSAFNLQRAIAYLKWSGTFSDDWASTDFVDLRAS